MCQHFKEDIIGHKLQYKTFQLFFFIYTFTFNLFFLLSILQNTNKRVKKTDSVSGQSCSTFVKKKEKKIPPVKHLFPYVI